MNSLIRTGMMRSIPPVIYSYKSALQPRGLVAHRKYEYIVSTAINSLVYFLILFLIWANLRGARERRGVTVGKKIVRIEQ